MTTQRPGETEAVEAALVAFRSPDGWIMEHSIAAAYPIIAAAVAEQIAQRIEALEHVWHFRGPRDYGVEIVSRHSAIDAAREYGKEVGS